MRIEAPIKGGIVDLLAERSDSGKERRRVAVEVETGSFRHGPILNIKKNLDAGHEEIWSVATSALVARRTADDLRQAGLHEETRVKVFTLRNAMRMFSRNL